MASSLLPPSCWPFSVRLVHTPSFFKFRWDLQDMMNHFNVSSWGTSGTFLLLWPSPVSSSTTTRGKFCSLPSQLLCLLSEHACSGHWGPVMLCLNQRFIPFCWLALCYADKPVLWICSSADGYLGSSFSLYKWYYRCICVASARYLFLFYWAYTLGMAMWYWIQWTFSFQGSCCWYFTFLEMVIQRTRF